MAEALRVPITVKLSIALAILGSVPGNVVNLSMPRAAADFGPGRWVAAVIGAGIAFLIYRAIWRGRKGARMFLTVVGSLATVLLVIGLVIGVPRYTWLDLISGVIAASAVVLLWVPMSRAYFDAAAKARQDALPKPPEAQPGA